MATAHASAGLLETEKSRGSAEILAAATWRPAAELTPARGIVFAVLLALPLWALIAVALLVFL
jgi:hypothetical protein